MWKRVGGKVQTSNNCKKDKILLNYSYNLFANSTGYSSSPYYINKMNSAILKLATNNKDAEINVGIYPFIYSYIE